MTSLFSTDRAGQPCVTEKGLDAIWPKDDREPAQVFLKAAEMPPTCETSLADRHTDAELLAFFNGDTGITPAVPAPPSIFLMVAALVVVGAMGRLR